AEAPLDARDPGVVVLPDVAVPLRALPVLAGDHLVEVVVRARRRTRAVEVERLVEVHRQPGDLTPAGEGRARVPHRGELLDRQAVHRVVLVDHDGQRVVGHGELLVLDPAGLARGDLLVGDRAGRVGDVRVTAAEPLEPTPGARG